MQKVHKQGRKGGFTVKANMQSPIPTSSLSCERCRDGIRMRLCTFTFTFTCLWYFLVCHIHTSIFAFECSHVSVLFRHLWSFFAVILVLFQARKQHYNFVNLSSIQIALMSRSDKAIAIAYGV